MDVSAKHHKPPVIELKHVSFSYEEEAPLLHDISLRFDAGECCLIGGASGSGKSTLALIMNGLYPEAVEGTMKGEVRLHGRPLSSYDKGEAAQHIGVLFQDPESQFCMIKVEDELAFVLENIAVPREEMDNKIAGVLQETGMSDFRHRAIHELSGGQKQKIALASVLLLDPEVLIVDEPAANLDPASGQELVQLIGRIRRTRGCTVLIIEHQADRWLPLLDRAVFLAAGKVMLDGCPDTLYQTKRALLKQEGIHLPFRYDPVPPRKPDPHGEEVIFDVRELTVSKRTKTIIQHLSFSLHRGEMLAIAGENGSGKTTLLQAAAGLVPLKTGQIMLKDKTLEQMGEQEFRQRTGFVFQNPEHQFITDTVEEELLFGPELAGRKDAGQWMEKLLERFRLNNHRHHNPFMLSGGQKRRLSAAVMLGEVSDVLFLDEPTFGQDAASSDDLMNMIDELRKEGTAIVMITHDMMLVDRYCHRVLVMKDGEAAFDGEPGELWKQRDLLHSCSLMQPEEEAVTG
ncbi:ABC transporter ATP-binding protein [Alkalicoccus luteus]|uniref:Energy-coupling factor ABC transporter ATP-binding protein n=1 Tax=Alkalicoccus luteus TaxID=1237094 RepID=A0A969TVU9_9BACI|nr:ABC transporter ATP-binding protein [Alkalicoccus luteus]NJP38391.1 energy-coupling factor ABC transporter ATP-binding protein [Alkalicoccus luteus]